LRFSTLTDGALATLDNVVEYGRDWVEPTVRLGVTGLSRAGKTVFITALVHSLTQGGRLPLFEAYAEGRLARARLRPQPDDAVPRFEYESHLAALTGPDRHWPESTRSISELRLVIEYQSASFLARTLSGGRLTLDIVDYPGEWLLDLPLLRMSFEEWSATTIALSREPIRAPLAAAWQAHLATLDPNAPESEGAAQEAARLFTDYLRACRDERVSLSTLPPGRFLLPGDLAGSPALTFAPLDVARDGSPGRDTLWAMMARRFEAYKRHFVKPFFREHFARLDRQIVLVDALAALNAGPNAVRDLDRALTDILESFRPGANTWLSRVLRRRVDRILFAATKADHLHHANHPRLEAILRRLVDDAVARAEFSGAQVEVLAMAAVRATRETVLRQGGEDLECVVGVPQTGERIGMETFDGTREFALFPGDLPADPNAVMEAVNAPYRGVETGSEVAEADLRFVRFRPPRLVPQEVDGEMKLVLPHIRLDRALQFLIGDKLA
jgi:predicted YcjX-like family ATPase